MEHFLPVNYKEMTKRGWDCLDFLLISGDAYVDHPSFGHAIISRVLENAGYRVGIIPQPNWTDPKDFQCMGVPRLAVLIVPGVLDSMVNHYTATKAPRRKDSYSPGGVMGKRPDRASIVYSNKARESFGKVPVILGGMEASLRRFAHYDYWQNRVRASILLDSGADLLVFGSGEKPMLEIAALLDKGVPIQKIKGIRGTCYLAGSGEVLPNAVREALQSSGSTENTLVIPSVDEVSQSKKVFARTFMMQYKEQDPYWGRVLIQPHGNKLLVQNPPQYPLTTPELDQIYGLPYTGKWHPFYDKDGGVPALSEVKFSITSHRGCFGSCAFCSITFHQGRMIQARSKQSILEEAREMTQNPNFKGYIHDIGGPTANFRRPACEKQEKEGSCRHRECMYPEPCKNLRADHNDYLDILRSARNIPGVKKVFIRSGIRFDYLLLDKDGRFFHELCKNHISGQLKVAPEHVSKQVLKVMRKAGPEVYQRFKNKYENYNRKNHLKQYLVPYYISGHPGSTLQDAVELAVYMKKTGFIPEQVQQFYPTPGTLSTCMYYTGINPETMEPVYVATSEKEKAMQRALLHFDKSKNHPLVKEALQLTGNENLIGFLLSGRSAANNGAVPGKGKQKGRKVKKDTRKKRRRRT